MDSVVTDSTTYAYRIRATYNGVFSDFTDWKSTFTYAQGIVADYVEYTVLKNFYDSAGGDNWTHKTNWLNGSTHKDFGKWYGVTVVNGDIVNLHLQTGNNSGNNLDGRIPQQIGALAALKSLRLNNNPKLVGQIPNSIGNLKLCTQLWLHITGLTGGLPEPIGGMTALSEISTYNTNIGGSIPESFFDLPNLTQLWMRYSGFEGRLPENFGNLTKVWRLYLHGNKLSGPIPESFKNIYPWDLGLAYNDFEDVSFEQFKHLTNVGHLYLSGLNLSGEIPDFFGSFSGLRTLALSDNNLTGSIPDTLSSLALLDKLYLYNNKLSGQIPHSMSKLKKMKYFALYNNALSGTLPSFLSDMQDLLWLNIWGNDFSGSIPENWKMLSKLEVLSIDNNPNLMGTIPEWIGDLTNLTYFGVSGTKIGGEVPDSFRNLTNLQWIDFDECNLEGSIPDYLVTFGKLHTLKAYDSKFTQLPAFGQHPNREKLTLLVHGNQLDFHDLEKQFSAPGIHPFDSLSYGNQADIPAPKILGVVQGKDALLEVATSGQHNQYQWQRQQAGVWEDIAGAIEKSLTITSAVEADEGAYRCRVTNDWVKDLTLFTNSMSLKVDQGPSFVNLPID